MRLRRVLCASIFACLSGGGVAEAAAVHPEAAKISYSANSHTLQPPEHADWYVLPGAATNTRISFSLLDVPGACTARTPVVVSLYNPEGHWIRALPGNVVPRLPYPGRYLLRVAVTDSSCAGARYRLRATPITRGSGGYKSAATSCAALAKSARDDQARSKLAAADARKAKDPRARTRLAQRSNALKQMAADEARKFAKTCH